jgi:hypothetical protein
MQILAMTFLHLFRCFLFIYTRGQSKYSLSFCLETCIVLVLFILKQGTQRLFFKCQSQSIYKAVDKEQKQFFQEKQFTCQWQLKFLENVGSSSNQTFHSWMLVWVKNNSFWLSSFDDKVLFAINFTWWDRHFQAKWTFLMVID